MIALSSKIKKSFRYLFRSSGVQRSRGSGKKARIVNGTGGIRGPGP
jgi:hypothetical protein